MAKTKIISLRGIVREISKTEAELLQAEKRAAKRGKKALALKIRKLKQMKRTLMLMCRNGFNVPLG